MTDSELGVAIIAIAALCGSASYYIAVRGHVDRREAKRARVVWFLVLIGFLVIVAIDVFYWGKN
jgi:cytochrome bd-type quinol oxidase subunit 2